MFAGFGARQFGFNGFWVSLDLGLASLGFAWFRAWVRQSFRSEFVLGFGMRLGSRWQGFSSDLCLIVFWFGLCYEFRFGLYL